MAHMFPEGGPTKDTTSEAERQMYALLQNHLDDHYYVFHSTPWCNSQDAGRIENGEVDFIIAHPDYGILLIEVKGGNISYRGATKQWTSKDGHGHIHEIKDPFQQVEDSKHSLRRYFKRVIGETLAGEYWLSHAVWFPNIDWERGSLPLPHINDDRVLDIAATWAPDAAIMHFFTNPATHRARAMSDEALVALIDVLAPTRTVKARLASRVRTDEETFIRLTDDQYRRLDMLLHYPNVLIRGAAGTGKTLLALTAARRFARDGLNVLLICASHTLSRWITNMLDEEFARAFPALRQRIAVLHMDALCLLLTSQAEQTLGLLRPKIERDREDLGDSSLQKQLASHLMNCIRMLERAGTLPRYDAIIVDEAQDIEQPLLPPVYKMLRDRANGRFVVFYDPAQRLDNGAWEPNIPNKPRELLLTDNCRNTQAIFSVSHQFYEGLDLPLCRGPEGWPVRCIDPAQFPQSKSMPSGLQEEAALDAILTELTDREGISPDQILIVTCRPRDSSRFYGRSLIGRHKLRKDATTRDGQSIRIVTIRSAKGLEANIVILVELDGLAHNRLRNYQLYVATSRAKHHLIVLGRKEDFLPTQPSLGASLISPRIE